MEDPQERNEALINFLVEQGVLKNPKIVEAFRRVPRHFFVNKENLPLAYQDTPLLLAKDSTISQPSAVATMLEFLCLHEGDRVLEIGAGSGWNAALMGYCVGDSGSVITLEIDRRLAKFATENIAKVGMKKVRVICKDGSKGHKEEEPYDKIIYTAATKKVPKEVLSQLKVGGVLLAPVGEAGGIQVLTKMEKLGKNEFSKAQLGYFQFVPMKGAAG